MKPTLIRVILIALLLAVQLATVWIVVMGMRNQTENHVGEVARESLLGLAERVAVKSADVTSQATRVVLTGRSLISAGVLDARVDEALQSYLLSQMRMTQSISRLQFARSDGSMVEVVREGSGLRSRVITRDNGNVRSLLSTFDQDSSQNRSWVDPKDLSDPRTSSAYELARQSDDAVWTDVEPGLIDGQGGQEQAGLTVAAVSLHPDTTDAGVLSASVSTRVIAGQLAGLPFADDGSVSLIDSRGNSLAYLAGESLAMSFDSTKIQPIEELVRPSMRRLFANLGISLVNEASPVDQWREKSGFSSYSSEGKDFFGLASPVELADGQLTWLLTAAVPADKYMGGLGELFKHKLRTLLAVILIPALIAVLAVFGLNEPVPETKEDSGTDELTGFVNRSEFRRRLEGMLRNRRELEYGGRIVVAAMEMDGFDKLIDRYGHETGEAVLRQFSRRLRSRVRQHDVLGRTGTGEFVIALRVDRGADVLSTLNRIRRSTVVKPFVTSTGRHILGVTAGIAAVDPNEGVDELLVRANQALITGKARHRNRSYLAAAPDTQWPQTGVALPADAAESPSRRAPTLEI